MNLLLVLLSAGVFVEGYLNLIFFALKGKKYGGNHELLQFGRFMRGTVGCFGMILGVLGL